MFNLSDADSLHHRGETELASAGSSISPGCASPLCHLSSQFFVLDAYLTSAPVSRISAFQSHSCASFRLPNVCSVSVKGGGLSPGGRSSKSSAVHIVLSGS